MRKKSHISLARGVVHGLDMDERFGHRLSLYFGSILPDCTISFLTKRHCMEETFDVCEKKMIGFLEHYKTRKKGISICSSVRMGVVLHYIADYFTFPHNAHYPGNLKDHCVYEESLKHQMRRFINNRRGSVDCVYDKRNAREIKSISDLLAYVREKHEKYVNDICNVNLDCAYSYIVSLTVMRSLLTMASGQA